MKVFKKIDRPVLFLGLPVNLAFAYALIFVIGVIVIMTFVTYDKYVLAIIPVVLMFYGMIRIRGFYTKYGHKGFTPAQRDKELATRYEVKQLFQKIINK